MRAVSTGHVSQSEWRWVTLVSTLLILIAMLPFVLAGFISSGNDDLQFMGILHRYNEGAANLSHMIEGSHGDLSIRYLHTPEPQRGMLLEPLYALLGQLARSAALEPLVIFHIARIGAALILYFALYSLGANIWTRIRARRAFFVFATMGGGLGWVLAPLTGRIDFVDLLTSGLYPYQATLYSVSVTLAIAALALLAGAVISALKVGQMERPTVTNEGITVFLLGIFIAIAYPLALVPAMIAFFGLILAHMLNNRKVVGRDFWWMLWFAVPAAPIIIYDLAAFVYNPVTSAVWSQLNRVPPPPIDGLLVGLLIPLVIAIPGLWRAVRRFEPDGTQFMLGWLLMMVLLIYLTPIGRLNFGAGLMIPLAYFVTRALEDFWFTYIKRPHRYRIFAALLPIMVASHLMVTFAPLQGNNLTAPSRYVLPVDYARAFRWLGALPTSSVVVMTAPEVGVWLPAWSGMGVVYGSPLYTLDSEVKAQAVVEWYSATDAESFDCMALLNGAYSTFAPYTVRYVIMGPIERAYGGGACVERLREVVTFDDVSVYSYSPLTLERTSPP